MRRFITKPNSKIDGFILGESITLLTMHFNWWIVGQFKDKASDYWWIWLPTAIAFGVVITYTILYLYWNLYSPIFVEKRLKEKVADFLLVPLHGCNNIPKACKLIDEICNATIVPIEERKVLYDQMCTIWTVYGCGFYKVYSVPGFITEKWKRAVIDYKKYEIEND